MNVGWSTGHLVTGAMRFDLVGRGELRLDHVGQLEILEEIIHEFFAAELEHEIILRRLVAVAALAFTRSGAAFRTLYLVALQIILVTGTDRFPDAAASMAEAGLVDILGRYRYFFAIGDIGDGAAFYCLLNRPLDLSLVTPQKAPPCDRRP